MTTSSEEPSAFEAFDRSVGVGTTRDPYPRWAKVRRETPVWVGTSAEWNPEMASMLGDEPMAVALSFDAVAAVLRDGETFSSAGYAKTMGIVMGHTILEMDEPEHFAYRSLIQDAFQRKQVATWEEQLVRPIIREAIAAFRDRGRADLVHELTFPFPVKVICGMIGIPEDEHELFHRLAVELISIQFDPATGFAASQGLAELFAEVLAARRAEPQNDLMTQLALAEREGQRLTDDEIFAFLRLLAPAGAETTYRSSSNLLFGLLSDPPQWEAVRADPALIGPATEEGLRWECPLTGISRTATRDAEVCGVTIPAGTAVYVCMGAANRDETRWEDPDRFDIHRPHRHHSSFAFGPHTCLGMHLARMETRVLLECLFEELPGLRLDPDADDVHISGQNFRSPPRLPVVFDV